MFSEDSEPSQAVVICKHRLNEQAITDLDPLYEHWPYRVTKQKFSLGPRLPLILSKSAAILTIAEPDINFDPTVISGDAKLPKQSHRDDQCSVLLHVRSYGNGVFVFGSWNRRLGTWKHRREVLNQLGLSGTADAAKDDEALGLKPSEKSSDLQLGEVKSVA
jgi:hypothetical protein